MSQPVALLVGGTKILERALQTALPVEVVIVATMEEAAKVMGERDVALAVLGPTLRRALAMVATLRREGADYPRLIVVYRDDQRDEVKRHQRGKAVADGYVPLSRIAKELAPMAQAQWHEGTRGQPGAKAAPLAVSGAVGDDVIDEIEVEAFEVDPEAGTREMDVLPPLGGALPGHDGAAAGASAVHEGTQELDLSDVVEVLDESGLEELPAAAVEEEAPIEELSADEIVAEELIEEISSDELISENVTHAAQAAVAAVDAGAAPAAAVETEEEVPESALEELTPDAVQPSSTPSSPQVVARIDAAAQEAAKAVVAVAPVQAEPGAAPAGSTRASRPQSGAYAMLGELTGFVERLQEASQLIHQLEGENEQLRQEVARMKDVARPELAADLGTAQQKAKDLQLRLEGAERARDAAVEARMKFEQQAGALRDEIEAGKAREAALESQLEARRRIAQDAAKSLRAIGQMMEG